METREGAAPETTPDGDVLREEARMFDIEAAMEARRERLLAAGLGSGARHDPAPGSTEERQLHRRWLALYRGDRWSLERIAAFEGVTITQIWCGIVLAIRHEPRHGRRRVEMLRAG